MATGISVQMNGEREEAHVWPLWPLDRDPRWRECETVQAELWKSKKTR